MAGTHHAAHVSEGMPGNRVCPHEDQRTLVRNTTTANHAANRDQTARVTHTSEPTTSTNTLTRPHSYRNADLPEALACVVEVERIFGEARRRA